MLPSLLKGTRLTDIRRLSLLFSLSNSSFIIKLELFFSSTAWKLLLSSSILFPVLVVIISVKYRLHYCGPARFRCCYRILDYLPSHCRFCC